MDKSQLIKRLNEFYIYANEGFYIDKVINKEDYIIAYNEKVKDHDCNYVTNLKVGNIEEFNELHKSVKKEMQKLNRETCYMISPVNEKIYNYRNDYLKLSEFKEVNNEVWQIFDNWENIEKTNTNCKLDIKLEKTNNLKEFSIVNNECFSTGDKEDPYGSLDNGYIEIYQNYKKNANPKYHEEFYFVKLNGEIVGVTVSSFGDGICGIYGLAIKKAYRKQGIGKEVLKQQLKICKDKGNIDIAFLQTEDGYYPAETYRKFGFKDVCNVYYYVEI